MSNKCLECGKEIADNRKFCSKSCGTKYHNRERVRLGTCNLLRKNGGSELARKHNKEMCDRGVHPFQKENFSEETRLENGEKHSNWVRNVQVKEGRHPWMLRVSRINNEFKREVSIYNRRQVDTLSLYISEVPEFQGSVKIGVSSDLVMRERDSRFPIKNPVEIYKGSTLKVLELEKAVKLEFSSEATFQNMAVMRFLDVQSLTFYDLSLKVQRLSKLYPQRYGSRVGVNTSKR